MNTAITNPAPGFEEPVCRRRRILQEAEWTKRDQEDVLRDVKDLANNPIWDIITDPEMLDDAIWGLRDDIADLVRRMEAVGL